MMMTVRLVTLTPSHDMMIPSDGPGDPQPTVDLDRRHGRGDAGQPLSAGATRPVELSRSVTVGYSGVPP